VHFGTDRVSQGLNRRASSRAHGLPALWQQGRHEVLAEQRANITRPLQLSKAGVYDPRVGGTGVIYVLHDASQPELYGGLPKDRGFAKREAVEGAAEVARKYRDGWRLIGLFVHYLRYGPKEREEEAKEPHEERSHERACRPNPSLWTCTALSFWERLNHWIAAFSYIYLLLTGLAFWSPWLFWIAVLMGGGQISRNAASLGRFDFLLRCSAYVRLWSPQMKSTEVDKQWWRSLNHYVQNEDDKMPPAGAITRQKLLFWSFFYAAIVLLLTGIVLWFSGMDPVESPLAALCFGVLASVARCLRLQTSITFMSVFADAVHSGP